MKKLNKIKLVLMMFAMIIAIGIPNIKAEEATNPNSFKDDEAGVAYTINGFEIRIYDASIEEEPDTPEDDDSDIPEEENNQPEGQNYSDRTPIHTITLDPTKYTIKPEYKTDKFYITPARYIDLNLSITKEDIEQEIKAVIPTLETENEAYYGELVVNYTFTTLPQEYPYYYNYDLMKISQGRTELPQITLNNQVSQILNYVFYVKQDEEDIVEYETELTEDNAVIYYIMNFAVFSKEEMKKIELTANPETTQPVNQYVYMFHNVDNIDFLIEALKEVPEEDEESEEEPKNPEDIIDEMLNPTKPEDPKKEQIVKVDDTSATISGLVYFISIIVITIGGTIIYKETKRKEIES